MCSRHPPPCGDFDLNTFMRIISNVDSFMSLSGLYIIIKPNTHTVYTTWVFFAGCSPLCFTNNSIDSGYRNENFSYVKSFESKTEKKGEKINFHWVVIAHFFQFLYNKSESLYRVPIEIYE